jgi:NhaA family Na+:H+ antiporter
MRERPLETIQRSFHELVDRFSSKNDDEQSVTKPLKQIRQAQRELLSPVQRIQMWLHPWVAFGIMPLFALANAGVSLAGTELANALSQHVFIAVILALVVGKPVGVILACSLLVKSGLCELPDGVTWPGVVLVGLLAGIGFTMSIFIASLAFEDASLLSASKLSVFFASGVAAALGLSWGWIKRSSRRKQIKAKE